MNDLGDGGEWFRWAAGAVAVTFVGVIKVLWDKINEVQDDMDNLRASTEANTNAEIKNVWEELAKIRESMGREMAIMRSGLDQDRQETWRSREKLASEIVTKHDLSTYRTEMQEYVDRMANLVGEELKQLTKRSRDAGRTGGGG